jgi:uncharacterized protein (UPF0276 family)
VKTLGAGLGLKPEHYEEALGCRADAMWFEVHAENYVGVGGPRRAWLDAIRSDHPLSLHSVSLSLAGAEPIDGDALAALAALVHELDPALVSEHLAWSRHGAAYLPDLLPFPRTREALALVSAHVGQLQDTIGRTVAIENPSHYLQIDGHELDEIEFLVALAERTGCSLLLDLNNVHVSAVNMGTSAIDVVDRFPVELVSEIHLAGHRPDPVLGERLLIDSHDAPVAAAVWELFDRFVERAGARPTLIERDAALPAFATLMQERETAQRRLDRLQGTVG